MKKLLQRGRCLSGLKIIVPALLILVIFFYHGGSHRFIRHSCDEKQLLSNELNTLVRMARSVSRAHRYSRSHETRQQLNGVFGNLRAVMRDKYRELETHSNRPSARTEAINVCPDLESKDPSKSAAASGCSPTSIGHLVTILINHVNSPVSLAQLTAIFKGFADVHPGIRILVATRDVNEVQRVAKSEPVSQNVKMDVVEYGHSAVADGRIWSDLAGNVETKYAFVGATLNHFNNESQLFRLVRMISYLNADVVGGSHRFDDGRWFRGCYQFAVRNYTLRLVEGYDVFYNSCIYCDLVASGPFLVRPSLLSALLDKSLTEWAVFVDFFLTLHTRGRFASLVCPDTMFYTSENELHLLPRVDWIPFARKHLLNRLLLTNGEQHSFDCSEINVNCPWARRAGEVMPLCCIQHLAEMVKYLLRAAERHSIDFSLVSGSLVGLVKLYGVLPWEIDSDLEWQVRNVSTLRRWVSVFQEKGYELIEEDVNYSECLHELNCGFFLYRSEHWRRVELYGTTELGSCHGSRVHGIPNVTKVLFDGMWIATQHNPARSARNEYGDDVFEHVEHWRTLGYQTGWVQAPTGNYVPCQRPGFHSCLDQYLPVGNVQFQDVWV